MGICLIFFPRTYVVFFGGILGPWHLTGGIILCAPHLGIASGIRTGDFDLREAALRKIARLFLGYNKYKYHDLCIKHLADICRMSPTERFFMSEAFSLSLSGLPGKNTGLDEIQEMTMNKDFKGVATGTDIRYLQKLGLKLQHFARCVQDFKEAFGTRLVYNRKIYASAHGTMSVGKMTEILTAEESPFRLQSASCRKDVISADGRTALKVLQESMVAAPETSTQIWENGVKGEFSVLNPDRSGRDAPRKQIRLPTFSSAPEGRKSNTRSSSKQIEAHCRSQEVPRGAFEVAHRWHAYHRWPASTDGRLQGRDAGVFEVQGHSHRQQVR